MIMDAFILTIFIQFKVPRFILLLYCILNLLRHLVIEARGGTGVGTGEEAGERAGVRAEAGEGAGADKNLQIGCLCPG